MSERCVSICLEQRKTRQPCAQPLNDFGHAVAVLDTGQMHDDAERRTEQHIAIKHTKISIINILKAIRWISFLQGDLGLDAA